VHASRMIKHSTRAALRDRSALAIRITRVRATTPPARGYASQHVAVLRESHERQHPCLSGNLRYLRYLRPALRATSGDTSPRRTRVDACTHILLDMEARSWRMRAQAGGMCIVLRAALQNCTTLARSSCSIQWRATWTQSIRTCSSMVRHSARLKSLST
jgi:hypothetical protein